MSFETTMNQQPETVPSHANERLMNPLFESDEQPASSPPHPLLSGQVEHASRAGVPWLVVLIVASLLFGILGLAANFLAMARGS